MEPVQPLTQYYKCKKCRYHIFGKDNLIKHYNEYKKKECDLELFVENVSWLNDIIEGTEGKINCPKCDAKLGSYSWCGFKCSCNAWVTPAFHVSKSKIDEPVLHLPNVHNASFENTTHESAD